MGFLFLCKKIQIVNYLSVENISKAYGERVLFEDISFGINKDQKVAFIAKNGLWEHDSVAVLKVTPRIELWPRRGAVFSIATTDIIFM